MSVAYYVAELLVALAIVVVVLRLWEKDLAVPFHYEGDTLNSATIVKGVSEDGVYGPFRRLGAPFGLDFADWPIGMPLDFTFMRALAGIAGDAGWALNGYWLSSMVATSLAATFCYRRLGVAASPAFVIGILYGILPFTFFRNVAHFPLVYNLVPAISLIALRLMEPAGAITRRFLCIAALACALQGLSFAYTAFFSAFFILFASLHAMVNHRSLRPLAVGATLLACLVSGATIATAPNLLYRWENGPNDALAYKLPAEAEHYGLKIRHLLTPIPDHPLALFRSIDRRIVDAQFPHETENATARLGTLASIGFIGLLMVALGIPRACTDRRLTAAASLVAAAILLSTVGAFGSLFSVFVSPDIRGYNRIAVFIGFFSLLAVGVALTGWRKRLGSRAARSVFDLSLGVLLIAGVADQATTFGLTPRYRDDAGRYAGEKQFVRLVETALPAHAMVFQLPHTGYPYELDPTRMGLYDHARAFLHSRSLHWSWGAMNGRHGDWQYEAARLPPIDFLRHITMAGFAAVWLDRRGYEDDGREIEAALESLTGPARLRSVGDRWIVFDLDTFRRRIADEIPREEYERRRREMLSPRRVRWLDGCYREERDALQRSRWCQSEGAFELTNELDIARVVVLSATLQSSGGDRIVSIAGPEFDDALKLTPAASRYERRLTLDAGARVRVRFKSDVGAIAGPGDSRALAVGFTDFTVADAD